MEAGNNIITTVRYQAMSDHQLEIEMLLTRDF